MKRRKMAEVKTIGRKMRIGILSDVHANEKPVTDSVLAEAEKDPRFANLKESSELHIIHIPTKFTSHGRAKIAKEYIKYLCETNENVQNKIKILNEKKKGFLDDSRLNIFRDGLAYCFKIQDLEEEISRIIGKHVEDFKSGKINDSKLLKILTEIMENREFIENGDLLSFCEKKTGTKLDFLIQLHSTPEKQDHQKPYVSLHPSMEPIFRKHFQGPEQIKSSNFRHPDSISIEFPSRYEDSKLFEDPVSLPGTEVPIRDLIQHFESKGIRKDEIGTFHKEIPLLMEAIYGKNYMDGTHLGKLFRAYIKKSIPDPDRVAEGKEALIRTLETVARLPVED